MYLLSVQVSLLEEIYKTLTNFTNALSVFLWKTLFIKGTTTWTRNGSVYTLFLIKKNDMAFTQL